MNIFEALELGDSSIREVMITALLGYFLDDSKGHSMGDELLRELIKIIDDNNTILGKYKKSSIHIEEDNIDLKIKLYDSTNEEFHRIIIENKIRDDAFKKDDNQLKRYYESTLKDDDFDTEKASITVLFITHQNCSKFIMEEGNKLSVSEGPNIICSRERDKGKHIFWSSYEREEGTIHNAILNILKKENNAEISPINNYVLHTIKSFAVHLESQVKNTSNTTKTDGESCQKFYKARDENEIIEKMQSLKEKLRKLDVENLTELDLTYNCEETLFYCDISPEYRISIQSRNHEDMSMRVLLRPTPTNGNVRTTRNIKLMLVRLCDDIDGLESRNYGEYAFLTRDNKRFYFEDTQEFAEKIKKLINNISKKITR